MKLSAALRDPVFSRAIFKLAGAVGAAGRAARGPSNACFWVARGAMTSLGVARLSGRGGLKGAVIVVGIVGVQGGMQMFSALMAGSRLIRGSSG